MDKSPNTNTKALTFSPIENKDKFTLTDTLLRKNKQHHQGEVNTVTTTEGKQSNAFVSAAKTPGKMSKLENSDTKQGYSPITN